MSISSTWRAYHPQTNGICERFHRTIKEEFYDVAFRKKIYTALDGLQADLDRWITYYNAERPHGGKYRNGRTPLQTFSDTRHLADEKMIDTLFRRRWLGKILIHSLWQRNALSVRACLDYYG